jgi:inosine-uridine nucleoside N-ribohydrolase/formylmethanofuran dehydrogenase subunit E
MITGKKLRIISAIFSVLIICETAEAQPLQVRRNHTVIIDSDCAIDDMRAISLLLSRPEITVKAILVSDGSLPPDEGAGKVISLLSEFNSNSIPVATGETIKGISPPWRQFNMNIDWGKNIRVERTPLKAIDCLSDKLINSDGKIILICLGPLTNVAQFIRKYPDQLTKIERIIWYNESVKPLNGFNYECDKAGADLVFRSKIRIDVISNLKYDNVLFDSVMYQTCSQSETALAKILYFVHSQNSVQDKIKQNHFRLSDELISLYLTNPELFGINPLTDNLYVRYNQRYDIQGVKEAFIDMINGIYVAERNIVFNKFPVQREMFNYDVRQIIDSAIARYGYDEWKATVMTDEFHGHLGVFSIVGAKMGIRAREIFGVGPDMLEVLTYAGSSPPYSCLNDGIQVSTGATLGMGTIHLSPDTIVRPSAVFSYKGRSVKITLKKKFLDMVDDDINEGILKFGLMDDGYWKLIRYNALKYWVDWDRNKIFDIEEIQIIK